MSARQEAPRPHSAATAADSSTQWVETPQFSVAAGSYASAQTVTITDATPGATIYYSTNGTYPYPSAQTQYNGPVTVSASEILVAVATASGYENSDWGVAEYLITSVPSRFTYTVAGNGTRGNSGDGGPGPAAKLGNPVSAVADDAGNVYVADAGDNVIRKVDGKTGMITTIAGTGQAANSGDGGPASNAALWWPAYLALDGSGHLYISENGDNVVRKLDLATGQITAFAGNSKGSAAPGPATSINLGSISGLATDSAGNVYICTGEVIKVDVATGNATEYVGYATVPGFNLIGSFAMDSRGNVYGWQVGAGVIDKITPTGQISVYAGKTGGGYPPNGGDGGPATSAYLGFLGNLATDSAGNLYISDSLDYAIREVNTSGIINTIAGVFMNPYTAGGSGDPSTSSALSFPQQLSVDHSGNIYVANGIWYGVVKIAAPAAPPTAVAAAPSLSLSAGTYADPQQLEITSSTPGAEIFVTFDGSDPTTVNQGYHGPISVNGSTTIKAIAVAPGYLKSTVSSASYTITSPPTAIISTVAGTGRFGFSASGGPATSTSIGDVWSAAPGPGGSAYLADLTNDAVWKVDSTGTLSLVAGTGNNGFAGDGGPATSAELSFPQGVAVDGSGNVYIADTGNNRIRRVDAVSGVITTVAGGGTTMFDGGPATGTELRSPSAVAFDSHGNLYIADTNYGRVRMVNAKTGIIETIAGSFNQYPNEDGVPAVQQDITPVALALDKNNNVYVADRLTGSVREIDGSTNIITTVAGGGTAWPADSGSVATSVIIDPNGVAVAADGTVYFSDAGSVIRNVDRSTGLLSTVAGNTYYGYSGDGGAASMASLHGPGQLALDGAGNLLIADSVNDAVRKVTFPAPAAAPEIGVPSGTYTSAQHITLSDSTQNATIYYTLDGSTPDAGSTVYSAPLVLRDSATLMAAAAAPGHPLSAIVSANYTITLQTPTIALTSSAAGAFVSDPITFTAKLSGASATPTGSVTFLDGTATLGTSTISNGTATYTTSSLTAGSHTITASYEGDDNFNAGTSSAVTVTVQDFSVGEPTGGSTSATVQPGGTAKYTLAVTPPSGSTTPADITFSVSGLPAGATGTFNPATVPAGSGATNVTLSVTVPAQSAMAERPGFGALPAALGLLLLPLAGIRRGRRALRRALLLFVVALTGAGVLTSITGCGGGSSSTTQPQPQTYNLVVTATSGSLSHTTNLTLTVE